MVPHTGRQEWRRYGFLPIAAGLGYATSVLHIYSIGPFIEPLQHEFGWSRGEVSSGITIASFLSALFCIPIGMLVDRMGPRLVGLLGVILMAGTVALLSTATGSGQNWALLWGVIALANLCVQSTIWTSAVTSRFESSRGLALAITLSGASISVTVFPLLATWLIGDYGWRMAYIAMSGIWLALVFPVLFLFFRSALDDKARLENETKKANATITTIAPMKVLKGLTFAQGVRTGAFYKLLMAGGLFAFTALGVIVHFVPILTDSGADKMAAAGIAALVGIFSIIGRLTTGMLLDRFSGHMVGGLAFLLPLIGCLLLLLDGTNPQSQMLAAASFGLTLGAEVDVIAYLSAKYFGMKNFGALFGAMVMSLSMGTAFGPLAAGMVYDHFNSYAPFLVLMMVLMSISSMALFSLKSAPTAEQLSG